MSGIVLPKLADNQPSTESERGSLQAPHLSPALLLLVSAARHPTVTSGDASSAEKEQAPASQCSAGVLTFPWRLRCPLQHDGGCSTSSSGAALQQLPSSPTHLVAVSRDRPRGGRGPLSVGNGRETDGPSEMSASCVGPLRFFLFSLRASRLINENDPHEADISLAWRHWRFTEFQFGLQTGSMVQPIRKANLFPGVQTCE